MTTRGLVLAGGGLAGIAWELGVLLGLADSGVDVASTADLVIGTSAGSTVAAQITSGETLEISFARQLEPTTTEIASDVEVEDLQRLMTSAAEAAVDRADYWRRVGAVALATSTVSEAVRHAVIAARLPETDWPRRRLVIPAIDVEGFLKVFDAESGVPLVDAVAASCAVPGVWPPVTIGGHRYIDGGVRSATNADLSAGADIVVVLTPAFPDLPDPVPDELLAAGIPASVVVVADADSIAGFGTNWLDPATRRPSALAGRALGRVEAARVAAVWNASA